MHQLTHDDDVPPGWRVNPAAWPQRLPIIGLAVIGAGIATYLALYQYGVVSTVWEPFFGEGSRRVLTSDLSFVLPVSDAALGAVSYLADAVTGAIGGTRRWRTMPWIVVVFGIAVGPLGAISILLVIAQPLLYDSFCTLCLASAVISLAMIGPAMDEVLAALQHVRRVQRAGGSAWDAFWGRESIEAFGAGRGSS
ncbi:MAG TPA: vitamin K epoxide reductase family protein [Egibacteraceae bacterium]|nr:vitamin K epoxide reductase family protein [Egibacteraceae bacterium]